MENTLRFIGKVFERIAHLLVCAALVSTAALQADTTLFVTDAVTGQILRLTPSGGSTFASGLNHPAGLAFDSSGNLYEADSHYPNFGSGAIYKFTPDGVGTIFASGLGDPIDVAVDASGNVYVADAWDQNIYKFTPDGVRSTFASGLYPVGLVFDSSGNLYEADPGDNIPPPVIGRIYKFTPNGGRSTFASGLDYPIGLAFDSNGNLFVSDSNGQFGAGVIYKFTPDGGRSTFASGLYSAGFLAFDSTGNLFAADQGGFIYKFTPDGVRSTFASALTNPLGLAIAKTGSFLGIDLSAVPSSTEWATLIANFGPTFVIADAWGGGTEKRAQQILDSAPAGIKKAAYLLLNYDDPSQSGPTQVGYAIEALGSEYQPGDANGNLSFMAVDIEPICYQTDSKKNCTNWESLPQDIASIAARFQRIYEAVQAVERAGLNPVIYSNQSAWTQIAGGTTPANSGLPLGCLPLWNPQYDLVDNLGATWTAFGAWTQRVGKQYAENDTAFGSVDVDLNVFIPSVFSGGSWGMALDETDANLGANVAVSRGGFRLNHATNQFVQTVTITNTSAGSIPGPVSLALDNLSSNATLVGANGATSCTVPAGSSFLNVQQGPLASGQSVTATLQFSNPTNQGIIYSPRVLAGSGTR